MHVLPTASVPHCPPNSIFVTHGRLISVIAQHNLLIAHSRINRCSHSDRPNMQCYLWIVLFWNIV